MGYEKGGFVGCLKGLTGVLVFIVSIFSLLVFYSTAYYLHKAETCRSLYGTTGGYEGFDAKAFSERVAVVLEKMESLQKIPDDGNVRWNNYRCKDFKCLSSKNPNRGYSKCTGSFEMEKERVKWVTNSSLPVDFLITDVLDVKPGEVRIGLDYSVDTGTFGARMKERNVTIISTAFNLGAPFNEIIALRGLLLLYSTPNQRLPFFDNTMDLVHTTGFLDGWIDLVELEFVLFDWDRILRLGALLWVDRFFCPKNQTEEYTNMFQKLRYKRHKWVVAPKAKDEVYLSVLLEKPQRSL